MSSPITVDPDRASREESYLQHGSSFVDRLRTRLVQREILKRLPQTSGLRVLDLGCGYHATYLKAIGKRLAEGVGVDFHVSEESRRHPRLSFVTSSVEDALPELPSNAFDAVLFISVLASISFRAASHRLCSTAFAPDSGRNQACLAGWTTVREMGFSVSEKRQPHSQDV